MLFELDPERAKLEREKTEKRIEYYRQIRQLKMDLIDCLLMDVELDDDGA